MRQARLAVALGWRDLRRRATESALLLAALTVAAATLTTGLALHGQTGAPYAGTRAATAGPDATAMLVPAPGRPLAATRMAELEALRTAPGVTAAAGPFPETWASLQTGHLQAVAMVQGRGEAATVVDRPHLVSGSWIRPGGVVVERAFAVALGVSVGDRIALGGTSVTVAGIAVSAALPAYPRVCTFGCILDHPSWHEANPGLVWATRAETLGLVSRREPAAYVVFLRLADPASAAQFAAAHSSRSVLGPLVEPWQEVARRHAEGLRDERAIVLFGSSLLVLLALRR